VEGDVTEIPKGSLKAGDILRLSAAGTVPWSDPNATITWAGLLADFDANPPRYTPAQPLFINERELRLFRRAGFLPYMNYVVTPGPRLARMHREYHRRWRARVRRRRG
jgi:hypothetical protein